MSTQRKFTVLLSAVASSFLFAACASHPSATNSEAQPPMVVADYNSLSAADFYAQRYRSLFAQVKTGGKHRFVNCESSCPGVTPKTPITDLKAAVAKRALQNLAAGRTQVSAPSTAANTATLPPDATATANETVGSRQTLMDQSSETGADTELLATNDGSTAARGYRDSEDNDAER